MHVELMRLFLKEKRRVSESYLTVISSPLDNYLAFLLFNCVYFRCYFPITMLSYIGFSLLCHRMCFFKLPSMINGFHNENILRALGLLRCGLNYELPGNVFSTF